MIATDRVDLAETRLSTRVLRSGSGTPVLLLHGSPDDADEWRRVMDLLGSDFACIAPDLPGLGASQEPPPSFDYSRTAIVAFLDELLASLEVDEPVVLVVHDIGGIFGIPWAAANLGRVRGVVITKTVVFENFQWFGVGKLWSRTDLLGRFAAIASMAQIGWLRGRIFRAGFKRISPELPDEDLDRITREFACDSKSKRSTLRLFRKMVPAGYFAGMDGMVRRLIPEVPVRVIWGHGDPYIPAGYAEAFPGAELEVIEHGGHWIPISSADRVAGAVRSILAIRRPSPI